MLDIVQSVVERHRFAPSDEVAQALLDDVVRQIVGAALTKDTGTKQWAKKDVAGPGDGR